MPASIPCMHVAANVVVPTTQFECRQVGDAPSRSQTTVDDSGANMRARSMEDYREHD
jgi:hypothetical protein